MFQVLLEIGNALNSVMTEKDFENFVLLEPSQRMESLKEIRSIVCGIVLFNKDTGVGNASDIPDCKLYFCVNILNLMICSFSDKNSYKVF